MKNTKSTKKVTKPMMIVDLTTVKSTEDISDAFILAKVNAGIPIDETDLVAAKFNTINRVYDELNEIMDELDKHTISIQNDNLVKTLIKEIEKATKPKKPWYKRAWSWVKKPFTKKK